MSRQKSSVDSLTAATESRASFSGHGNSKGAAGYQDPDDVSIECDFLNDAGQSLSINPPEGGFQNIRIGLAWDQLVVEKKAMFGLVSTKQTQDVDLDLGCIYELQDGSRGALQPFGEMFGALKKPPYIRLSGDEREGDEEGEDEYMMINGQKWPEIKRLLLYVYIYDGAPHWAQIKPQVHIYAPGEAPMIVTLHTYREEMRLCALAGLENVRNGIRLTNYTEYYPGHAEMDRAHGFGIQWDEGSK